MKTDFRNRLLEVYGYTAKHEGTGFLSIIGPFHRFEFGVDRNFDFEVPDAYGPYYLYSHNLHTGKLRILYLGKPKK